MSLLGVLRTIRRRRRLIESLEIRPTDVVLEVGSGQAPNPRANVLCDLFVGDDTERNEGALVLDRPLVVGDVQNLPFRDGSFDYVICSHVLEHVEDPERAANELARVAPRGYVEVPSLLHERMCPFPFHRWTVVSVDAGSLVFETKKVEEPDPELATWFREVNRLDPKWQEFLFDHIETLGNVHGQRWEGHPRLVVNGPPGPSTGSSPDPDPASVSRALERAKPHNLPHRLLRWWWSRIRQASQPRTRLEERLACPRCRGPVDGRGGSGLRCLTCGSEFPVATGGGMRVPILTAARP